MRRIVWAATVALLMLLTLAGAASAAGLPSSRGPDGRPPGNDAGSMTPQPRAHFIALGARLAGGAVVNGHVYDYYGAAVSGAAMYWEAPYGETWEWGEATTDGAGAYSFSGLPAAAGQGYLSVRYPTDPWSWAARASASWADPGPTTFDWRPGAIPTSITRGTVWPGWDYATAYLYGSDALSDLSAGSDIWGAGGVVTGDTLAMPGAYQSGAVYFWMDQGIEFATTATVTAGAVSGQSISVDQADAQRIWATTPYWGSGKPGTVAKVRHWNFPAGWTLDFYGYGDTPSGLPEKSYGSLLTTGADPFTKSVTIPTTATPGYWYVLQTDHRDGALTLDTPFQVCTLKSSKSAVRSGGSIKLSGIIPTEGHWGSQAGKVKYVTIFKRTRSVSAAPKVWDATTRGWTKVARIKASGLGKYASAYLKPTRTTWYVVRYPDDNWYYGGYTSVLKVRVY